MTFGMVLRVRQHSKIEIANRIVNFELDRAKVVKFVVLEDL